MPYARPSLRSPAGRRVILLPAFRRGFGDQTIQQITGQVGSIVTAAVSFIPVVGPLAAGAAALATSVATALEGVFSGCGQSCVQATQFVNQAVALLQNYLSQYMAQPVHYASMQAQYLAIFDATWARLVQLCEQPALGSAGKRCISERQRGGVAPWCPNPGHTGCDMFVTLRDPVANDPNVIPDPSPVSSLLSSAGSLPGSGLPGSVGGVPIGDLILPAALIVWGLLL